MTHPRKRAAGAGRKRITPAGTVRKTITLLPEDLAHLYTINAKLSLAVRELVRRDRGNTPASEALATHIALIHDYAAYYAEVAARGDAPETFADWFHGAR
jgi:hypothetical protein